MLNANSEIHYQFSNGISFHKIKCATLFLLALRTCTRISLSIHPFSRKQMWNCFKNFLEITICLQRKHVRYSVSGFDVAPVLFVCRKMLQSTSLLHASYLRYGKTALVAPLQPSLLLGRVGSQSLTHCSLCLQPQNFTHHIFGCKIIVLRSENVTQPHFERASIRAQSSSLVVRRWPAFYFSSSSHLGCAFLQ